MKSFKSKQNVLLFYAPQNEVTRSDSFKRLLLSSDYNLHFDPDFFSEALVVRMHFMKGDTLKVKYPKNICKLRQVLNVAATGIKCLRTRVARKQNYF